MPWYPLLRLFDMLQVYSNSIQGVGGEKVDTQMDIPAILANIARQSLSIVRIFS